ncbi:MAG: 2-dehydro-3-deoxygalactonokinase [Silicimonas sp.]|nr:2-dehydro-3-deoxygalactonokinase [Silicimonas sp.]
MNSETSYADWIAVDWGTSNARAWAMRGDEAVAHATSDAGMGSLAPDQFEPALLAMIEPWLGRARMPVVACGMVGAKQGWCEAAYAAVPCPPVGGAPARPETRDSRLDVAILPGLSQSGPADVMRGEETQIAGFLAQDPDFDGVLCLPGTHTKWAQISAGEVVSFRTFMTGELYALISGQSVLRHSVGEGWDEDAFGDALSDAMARPEAMANRFFSLRAESLLTGLPPGAATARLSGLLIGAELAAARPYWLGQRIAMIGTARLTGIYGTALTLQGAQPETTDATNITLAGLTAAYHRLKDTP